MSGINDNVGTSDEMSMTLIKGTKHLDADTLIYTPGTGELSEFTLLTIVEGKFKDIQYHYGKVWFPDENEPVMSFEYNVDSIVKPAEEDKVEFENEIAKLLAQILERSIAEQTAVYKGGTDK